MSTSSLPGEEETKLYVATMQGKWEEVVKIYEEDGAAAWLAKITGARDTALHVAINEEREDIVEKLVGIIGENNSVEALVAKNESGDTPLHRAAARESVRMCECIVKAGQSMGLDHQHLLTITNNWGQNPFLVATLNNRKQVFFYLMEAASGIELELILRNAGDGDTVLHSAIKREYFDLAFQMIRRFPDQLLDKCNSKGMTPLHVLANKPSAFRSSYYLSWWKKIVYYSTYVEPLKSDSDKTTTDPIRSERKFAEKYLICSGGIKAGKDPENPNSTDNEGNFPRNYGTCFEFLAMVFLNFYGVQEFVKNITDVIKERQTHTWSEQILDELLKDPAKAYMNKNAGSKPSDPGDAFLLHDLPMSLGELRETGDKKEIQKGAAAGKGDVNKHKAPERIDTALLVAAQKGVVEVVNKILQKLPLSIHDTSSMKNKNIVLIAAENRKPKILDTLQKHLSKKPKLWQDLVRAVDSDENTMLHLAANYEYEERMPHSWQIHGAALQMQREMKWYEYVKSLLPRHYTFLTNKKEETPWQIFSVKHKKLVKDSGEWLKDTSESCSVVAALVAGVSYAGSSQFPGGINEVNARPALISEFVFEVFGVALLVGLCSSVTSLIMFLAILNSRKQPKDFKTNLPRRLLVGLSSLFVSIVSMLISFCAAHFYLLEQKFKYGAVPLYVATSLPASLYAIAQFPLYLDLFKALSTSVPQSHHFTHYD